MKALLSSSMGRQSPSFTQRMEAKKRQEEEEEERKRIKREGGNSSSPNLSSAPLSSSYNQASLRSFLYSPSPSSSPHSARSEGDSTRSELSSSEASSVVIEGFLTKQGQRFKTWKRRWCVVLADPNLATDDSTFENEKSQSRRRAKLYYAKQPQVRCIVIELQKSTYLMPLTRVVVLVAR
jgi:hypothetical protein